MRLGLRFHKIQGILQVRNLTERLFLLLPLETSNFPSPLFKGGPLAFSLILTCDFQFSANVYGLLTGLQSIATHPSTASRYSFEFCLTLKQNLLAELFSPGG